MGDRAYEKELVRLQTAFVRWQQHAIEKGDKALVVFEGRDAAGKDGAIKRIVENLSIRATRVAALPKPSDRERSQWYFQRYVQHLPACGEFVLFNRSWYNRAGVEPVMGFCTREQTERFLGDVAAFEAMQVEAGAAFVKLWLDIDKDEQARRLDERRKDPLKALKISPLDAVAQEKWKDYTRARDVMLARTHTDVAPWHCVRANDKKAARIHIMRHLLHELAPGKLRKGIARPDVDVLFRFEPSALTDGRLAR